MLMNIIGDYIHAIIEVLWLLESCDPVSNCFLKECCNPP